MPLFKKEKVVDELILKHLDMVEDCVQASLKAGEFYVGGDLNQARGEERGWVVMHLPQFIHRRWGGRRQHRRRCGGRSRPSPSHL